jgi:cation efflux family protein
VEGLASITVIWRFTGSRTRSVTSERTAQRWLAGSFLLLVPFFVYESIHKLATGSDAHSNAVGIAVTASAIVLMPALGRAKMRLARRLDSAATAGEGVQNLMCAAQAAAALVALIGAGAGLGFLDPIAALVVSAIAVKECVALWRGETDNCCAPVGFSERSSGFCCADGCVRYTLQSPDESGAKRIAVRAQGLPSRPRRFRLDNHLHFRPQSLRHLRRPGCQRHTTERPSGCRFHPGRRSRASVPGVPSVGTGDLGCGGVTGRRTRPNCS